MQMRLRMIPFRLFTIGYEGKTVEKLLSALVYWEISVLIDVRHTAWSRKPGFSKSQLSMALENAGVQYVHLPQFGSPPQLRQRLYESEDWDKFAEVYCAYLASLDGAVEKALSPYQGKKVCFLCMEADAKRCHRSILAEELRKREIVFPPIHI